MKPAFPAARTPLPEGGARALRIAWFGVFFLCDLLAGLISQASSPDYRRLSLVALAFFAAATVLGVSFFCIFRGKFRWVFAVIHLSAGLLVLEVFLRVWVGIRLV